MSAAGESGAAASSIGSGSGKKRPRGGAGGSDDDDGSDAKPVKSGAGYKGLSGPEKSRRQAEAARQAASVKAEQDRTSKARRSYLAGQSELFKCVAGRGGGVHAP